jgi:hypothetical protein
MQELVPIVSGLVAGSLLGFLRPSLRIPVGIAAAVVLGTLATIVTGEFRVSWGFLLVDIPLVGLAAVAGFVGMRALAGTLGRPTKTP